MDDDGLSVTDIVFRLRVESATIERELRAGRLNGEEVEGEWRVKQSDFDAYCSGGDAAAPSAALIAAEAHFQKRQIPEAIRALVTGVGDRRQDPQVENLVARKLDALVEALDARDRTLLRKARFDPSDSPRSFSGAAWNKRVVDAADEALRKT